MNIGFIGLGLLGMPVATNLVDAGYELHVYNRTASKADPLVARGAKRAATAAEAAAAGIVLSLVWDDAALESIVTSAGFLDRLGTGIHVSMSTVSPETARKIAALHHQTGSTYIEAPIFGRPEAAQAKQLWMPIAGAADGKARVKPILEHAGARGIYDFGETPGAAVAVKIAGNFMIVTATRTMAEALAMAEPNGADPKAVVEMLTSTLFDSSIYKSYGQRLANKTPFPPSNIPFKDVGLFVRTAEQHHVATPLSSRMLELLAPPK